MANSDNQKNHNDDEEVCKLTMAGKIKGFIDDNSTMIIWVLVALIGYLLIEDSSSSNVVTPASQPTSVTINTSSSPVAPTGQQVGQTGGVLRLGNNILGRNYNQPGFTTTPSGLSRFL